MIKKHRIIICPDCRREMQLVALGRCSMCYRRRIKGIKRGDIPRRRERWIDRQGTITVLLRRIENLRTVEHDGDTYERQWAKEKLRYVTAMLTAAQAGEMMPTV